ncbi:MAG: P-type conjugative transfer protein TrbG [Endomicrobium sp.]|nr:P-type conjugative transfer protein TrbG [Endomicrobium sp.]
MKRLFLLLVAIPISINAIDILKNVEPSLNKKEQKAISVSKQFITGDTKAYAGKNGAVVFIYGDNMPHIVTAPLRITDITLERGEIIRDVQIGDIVRWSVSPAVSGEMGTSNEVHHIVIKPTEVGLETTLAIYTNRRAYHLNILSRKSDYMPVVSFEYPNQVKEAWARYYALQNAKTERNTITHTDRDNGVLSPARNLGELDFNYRIHGKANWTPIRVYNDGVQTYIQIPKTMQFNEAPVVLVVDSDGKQALVNYRLLGDRFIVDKLFAKAIMIVGIGNNQEKVEIVRENAQYTQETDKNAVMQKLLGGNK